MRRVAALPVILLSLLMVFPLAALAAPEQDQYESALSALREGDAQEAVTLLSKSIQAHPQDHRYYNDRGVAYKVLGSQDKALADYSKAIELKPDYVPALNNRGVLYLQQGLHDKAIEDFTEALKHGGIESKVLTNIGWAYANKGNHRDALPYLEKALAARPLDPRSFILMGQTLEQLGDTQRALQMYQLGVGLLREPGIVERVEKRIGSLERGMGRGDSSTGEPERQSARDKSGEPSKVASVPTDQRRSSTRQILPAPPLKEAPAAAAPRRAQAPVPSSGIDTLEALNERARSAAVAKMSPAAGEIYRQGSDFVDKGDLTKALVRYEDTLNLERRNKNHHTVAWSSLEIGRVYQKLGDQLRAVGQLEIAEKLFRRTKATNEAILALVELGNARRKAGQKEQATAAFKQAADLAEAAGHHRVAKLIEDAGAGKITQLVLAPKPPTPPAPKPVEASGPQAAKPKQAVAQAQPEKAPAASRQQAPEPKKQIAAAAQKAPTVPVPVPAQSSPIAKAAPSPEAAKPQPVQGQAALQPRPSDRDNRTAAPGRNIVRAETSPTPAAKSQPSPMASADTRRSSQGGVEAGAALAAAPELRKRKGHREINAEKAAEQNLKRDLVALRQYRELDDEPNMIVVLERLAGIYLSRSDYNKASLCLGTAVMLREKLGLEQGKDRIVQQRGVLREILGDSAGALEDFTWALALSTAKPGSQTGEPLEQRSRKLANQLRLDEAKAIAAYRSLWKARQDGDPQRETEAFYTIAGLYERANKSKEALNYYERALASILVDKARMYKKMGDAVRSEESFNLALETFKKLDYAKYVHLMKQLKAGKTLSKQ